MASLEAVYRGDARTPVAGPQLLAGMGVVLAGGVTVVIAIALATTGLGNGAIGRYGARRLAGAIGGVGLLGMIAGGFVAMPTDRETLAGAAIGLIVALVGVVLFVVVYPAHWLSNGGTLPTFLTVSVFVAGTVLSLWSLFVAVATFQTRQHPGGSARLRVTETGRVELLEAPDSGSFGGVGLFGFGEGEIEPQNRPGTPSGGHSDAAPDGGATPDADRDTRRSTAESVGDRTVATDSRASPARTGSSRPSDTARGRTNGQSASDRDHVDGPDRYCGTCDHFRYERGTTPFCDAHDRGLDDLDPCPEYK
ncbi:MAG: hypothetical protein ABEJ86_08070 [Halococcoides sp.]